MDEYLIHYNHNHDKLGRFARSAGSASSSIGRKLSRKKDKNNTICQGNLLDCLKEVL